MHKLFKPLLISAAFVLIGAGCAPGQNTGLGDLPTTPPDDVMMADDAMMDKPQNEPGDTMMEDVEHGSLDGDAMMEDDAMMDDTSAMKPKKPYYIAYTKDIAEQAMAEGRPVVYYFWAAWCPICRAEEPSIKKWIETSEHPIAGFRVNYDTESALKAQYKVPYQHTTVFLNAKGGEVERFSGPMSEADFRAAFAKAAK